MPESEEDYDGKITGYPLLDGMLFGNGVPRNRTSVLIRASELPSSLVEKIQQRFEEAGFQAGVAEIINSMTKQMDLRICVTGPSPIFSKTSLPRLSERRIDPQNVPIEFIVGFFFVSTDVKLKEFHARPHLDGDSLRITTKLPKEVVIEMLSILGVEEYLEIGNNIYLEVGMFDKIQPFEELYNEYKKESKSFASYLPSKEDVLAAKIDELMGEMDGQTVEEPVKDFDEHSITFMTFCSSCNKMTLHRQETEGGITQTWCTECKD
jgi:hypothetical protein